MGFVVIPAVDMRGGKAVRLAEGDFDRETRYFDDPVEAARRWVRMGARRLHLVDLDAAKGRLARPPGGDRTDRPDGSGPRRDRGGRPLDGDGRGVSDGRGPMGRRRDRRRRGPRLRSWRHQAATPAGLSWVSTPGTASSGPRAGARGGSYRRSTSPAPTPDTGIAAVIYTDIARDGVGTGIDSEGTRRMAREAAIPVIASGGVRDISDVQAAAGLYADGVIGVIVGRALYEGTVDLAAGQRRGGRDQPGRVRRRPG